ncbi:MAG: sigma-70 family RNA polymerase sigma factor [Wenzhouxiangella sp.]|nr:sigma-70 family RNA polymerase sigma factor [Wenzhouxiangella sp.]MCH8476476.1 sigma-70 family RNA polymerase sigma factor [Wenzhouxiangella sp.]
MPLSEQAFEAAYRRLEKPLYNYLYRWFWNPAVCEDLIHDAFERIWNKRKGIDEHRLNALVWTTTINLARNLHRRLVRWQWLPLLPSLRSIECPEALAQQDERERRLRDALERLPRASREVILLGVFAGVDRAELADMLGIPAGTLASRKHAATKRLQEMLEDGNDD